MILQHLTARHFRNLEVAEVEWGDGFNVIWGDNAQGKTNLLEAVYLLGHLKSFRGAKTAELIHCGSAAARLSGAVSSQGVEHQLELTFTPQGQIPRLDGKGVQRLSRFLGVLRTVLFTADELALLKGPPAGRRLLLDRALLQTDPGYLELVQSYNRVVRQRGQLLKERVATQLLAPWDEALLNGGAQIRAARSDYVARLQPLLAAVGREIGGEEELGLRYPLAGGPAELRAGLQEELVRLNSRERLLGQCLAGPHRDDPELLVNGRPVKLFASQGQLRSFLLAYKAAQLVDLERRLGAPPPLLLDDLTSELDARRQGRFFAFLRQRQGQVLITTTHPSTLGAAVCPQARYFHVEAGTVSQCHAV